MKDIDGFQASLPARDWVTTQLQTRQVWEIVKTCTKDSEIDDALRTFGIRDTLLENFIDDARGLKKHAGEEAFQEYCTSIDARLGDWIFNPFLRLPGKSESAFIVRCIAYNP